MHQVLPTSRPRKRPPRGALPALARMPALRSQPALPTRARPARQPSNVALPQRGRGGAGRAEGRGRLPSPGPLRPRPAPRPDWANPAGRASQVSGVPNLGTRGAEAATVPFLAHDPDPTRTLNPSRGVFGSLVAPSPSAWSPQRGWGQSGPR